MESQSHHNNLAAFPPIFQTKYFFMDLFSGFLLLCDMKKGGNLPYSEIMTFSDRSACYIFYGSTVCITYKVFSCRRVEFNQLQ